MCTAVWDFAHYMHGQNCLDKVQTAKQPWLEEYETKYTTMVSR